MDILEEIRNNELAQGTLATPLAITEATDEETISVRDESADVIEIASGRGRGRNKKSKRIPLTITDGKIDLSRNNDTQVKQLAEAFEKSPEAQQKLAPLATTKPTNELPLSLCEALYDGVAAIEKLVAIHVAHYPPQVAVVAFRFTPEQKAALAPPTQKVLNKYIPASYLEHAPEAELALVLFGVIQQQIAQSQMLLVQWNKNHVLEHGPNGGVISTPTTSEVQ